MSNKSPSQRGKSNRERGRDEQNRLVNELRRRGWLVKKISSAGDSGADFKVVEPRDVDQAVAWFGENEFADDSTRTLVLDQCGVQAEVKYRRDVPMSVYRWLEQTKGTKMLFMRRPQKRWLMVIYLDGEGS